MFNQEEVRAVAKQSSTSQTIFNSLAQRKRFRRETNLKKFQETLLNEGLGIKEEDYFETFKALEKMGIGSLVIGRKGNANRFIWNYSLKEVAKSAVNKKELTDVQRLGKKAPVVTSKKKTRTLAVGKEKMIKITLEIPHSMLDLLKVG